MKVIPRLSNLRVKEHNNVFVATSVEWYKKLSLYERGPLR